MVMTALMGHLMETDFTSEYKSWNQATTKQLFHAQVTKYVKEVIILMQDMKALADNLKKEARLSQMVLIWTDCDREGDNIGAEVVDVCREVNPGIIVKRARFSVVQHRWMV